MTTVEIALRSYRVLLAKHHPEELKQDACVNAVLNELAALESENAKLEAESANQSVVVGLLRKEHAALQVRITELERVQVKLTNHNDKIEADNTALESDNARYEEIFKTVPPIAQILFHATKDEIEINELKLKVTALEATVAELGVDKRRLDFLTSSGLTVAKDIGFSGACDVWACFDAYCKKPVSTANPFPMFIGPREAIDAALATHADKGENPICPQCGNSENTVKHGAEWVCHSTHLSPPDAGGKKEGA